MSFFDTRSALASDRFSYQKCRNHPHLPKAELPENDLVWNILCSKDSLSMAHIDAAGFGTSGSFSIGTKIWCLAVPKDEPHGSVLRYDEKYYDPQGLSENVYHYEWITLSRGTHM